MGRKKVVMEAIKDDKKRNITFHRRKEGIMKKALELTTLCDVNVSMIICTDKDQEPQIFPPDVHKLNTLIDLYRQKRATHPRKVGFDNVSNFFNNRKIRIEEELAKAKNKNLEAKYPTWFDFLNDFSEGQLREFAFGIGNRIDDVKTKIESLKKNPKIQNPMDYNNLCFDPADQYNLMIEQPSNPDSVMEQLMKEIDNDDFHDFESLINFEPPPPPLGCSFPVPTAPPDVQMKPLLMSDFPSQMMEYNSFGFDPVQVQLSYGDLQYDKIINQPSNPSSLTEMPMRKDVNACCNHDPNSIQPLPVAPQMVQQPEAPSPVMNMNPPFFESDVSNSEMELLMKEIDNGDFDFESLINFEPPSLGCCFNPQSTLQPKEAAPPAVQMKPLLMSDFPSQMMEYNNFGIDLVQLSCDDLQYDMIINEPSNPSSLTEISTRKNDNACCNCDQNFSIRLLPVAYSFPPPQMVRPSKAPLSAMHMNPPFFKSG